MIDLDHFRERGFVRVNGALDPELVIRWRDEAFHRLRASTPADLHDSVPRWTPELFAGLDPHKASTWRARRATLSGSEKAHLHIAAPQAFAAVEQLVGTGRLRRAEFTNYLILSFPERGVRRWTAPLRPKKKTGGSYHLDDPSTATSLSGWRNAVLMVLLFSDIEPNGGGTLLACDSPPRVARALAGGDADFVSPALGVSLAADCTDIQEVTGAAGDVLLLHPFMLHSTAGNRRKTVRVLANPMLSVKDELAFVPGSEARSPLEEITQEWAR